MGPGSERGGNSSFWPTMLSLGFKNIWNWVWYQPLFCQIISKCLKSLFRDPFRTSCPIYLKQGNHPIDKLGLIHSLSSLSSSGLVSSHLALLSGIILQASVKLPLMSDLGQTVGSIPEHLICRVLTRLIGIPHAICVHPCGVSWRGAGQSQWPEHLPHWCLKFHH